MADEDTGILPEQPRTRKCSVSLKYVWENSWEESGYGSVEVPNDIDIRSWKLGYEESHTEAGIFITWVGGDA